MILNSIYAILKEYNNPSWSKEKIKNIQLSKLKKIVNFAFDNIPYYQSMMKELNILPVDISTVEDLKKLSITTKNDLRKIDTKEYTFGDLNKLIKNTTTGTTSEPFSIYSTNNEFRIRQATELRCFFKNGYKLRDKVLFLGPIYPPYKNQLSKIGLYRRKLMSSFTSAKDQIEFAKKYKPNILRGYPSCLKLFANEYRKQKCDFLKIKSIFLGGEVLDDETRKILEDTFSKNIINIYGCWEFGRLAYECNEHDGLHLNEDMFIFEFNDTEIKEEKEIIVTSLFSYAMPLIRYKMSDKVVLIENDKKCSCGSNFKKIKSVKGRVGDYYIKKNNEKISVTNLTALFRKYVDIIPTQYKFIQYSLDNSEIKYIREKPLSVSELKKIKDAYELYVGKINIKFSKVENIPYDKSGKYRYFESKIKN